jgi:hypothetical protein
MALIKETPEAKSWVYDTLLKAGIRLPTVEGYSVKEKVTALFERLKSTVGVQKWSAEEISKWVEEHQNIADWLDRIVFASTLEVPLYLVLWQDQKEEFRILSVATAKEKHIEVEDEELFSSCKDLASWMSDLKGIQVSKRFIEGGRLSSIDECLRVYRVPWPGNLDGFLLNQQTQGVNAIFEFSRTRKFPVKTHNLNLYFSQDVNRWKPLDIMRKQLNVPLYILIWSSDESLVKIHCLRKITEKGLDFEETEILEEKQIVPWFKRFQEES